MVLKIFLCLFPFFLSSFVYADNSSQWLGGCETNFPPYNFIENGKPVGLDTEIVQLVMKKMGQKFSIETYPWARVLNSLEKDKLDFAWQFVDTPERREKFILVGPIRDGITVFMVGKNSQIKDWKTLDDLKGKRVGVVRAFKYTEQFDNATGFKRVEANDTEDLLKKLQKLEVDIIIGDLNAIAYLLRKNKYNQEDRILPTPVKVVPRFVGFSKKNRDKADRFLKTLNAVKETAEYKAIVQKYTSALR